MIRGTIPTTYERAPYVQKLLVAVSVLLLAAGAFYWWQWYTRPAPARVPRLAPPGTYFLVYRVSVTTDSGILGFPEGTRVRLIDEERDQMRVAAGTDEFMIAKTALTNDLDLAAAAAERDTTTRRRFEAWLRHEKALGARLQQSNAEAMEPEEQWREYRRRLRARPPIGSTPSPLDRGPYNRR